jgi:hypothetical protein
MASIINGTIVCNAGGDLRQQTINDNTFTNASSNEIWDAFFVAEAALV